MYYMSTILYVYYTSHTILYTAHEVVVALQTTHKPLYLIVVLQAQKATASMKPVLKGYYLKDETPIARATFRAFSLCQFVEDAGDVVFYKNVK